jgi:CRISPR-associated protein Csm4
VITTVNPMPILDRRKRKVKARTHFYFLLDHSDDFDAELLERLRACIRLLADEGIGGERSAGCGGFAGVEEKPWTVPGAGKGDKWVSLSLSIPEDAAAFSAYEFYRLQMRGGSAIPLNDQVDVQGFAGFDRQQVQMVSEGAVLSANANGMIANLAINTGSDQPIWRYGKLITLKL